jgi:Tfp pilus assembly protein PilP
MKLTTTILAVGMMTGGVWAQSPNVINNVQSTMNTVQQQKTQDSNAALGIAGKSASAQAAKPATAAPAKPAAQPAQAKPVAAKPAAATKPAASNSATAKPATTKPVTAKPAAAVPATHSNAAPATVAAKPAAKSAAKPAAAAPRTVIAAKESAPKTAAKTAAKPVASAPAKLAADAKAVATPSADASKAPKPEAKKWAMTGKRDPFFSPVVQQPSGSGCSTGKKCLEIRQINLRGVVKSETGFIAVVTNSLNKAYFLRENDPVFNGYVVKITGDAVVFQETVQDKLGKPLTREVVKRIFTPAV